MPLIASILVRYWKPLALAAVLAGADAVPLGLSQIVRGGYKDCSAHFQPGAQSAPVSFALILRFNISRSNPPYCRSHHIA